MADITSNFFNMGNDFFSLKNYECRFDLDAYTDASGKTSNYLVATPIADSPIYYSFSGNGGLCKTSEFGSIRDENLLQTLISLPENNAKALLHYFETNGFFFTLEHEHNIIHFDALIEIVKRIKSTVLLMNALEQKDTDYSTILYMTTYLLLGPEIKYSLPNNKTYCSYQNNLFQMLKTPHSNNASIVSNYITIDTEDYYQVKDMIYPTLYNLRVDEYEDISTGEKFMYDYPGMHDDLYRGLTVSYLNNHHIPKIQRLLIEFFFHFMHDYGVIKNVSYDNKIEFYKQMDFTMSDEMKKALNIIARYTLSQEIGHNVKYIRPTYNPITLEPTWKAQNLLAALYFSIFYMKPGSEIYRKCTNPSCNNYFLVKTSNSRKIYCCSNCRNAKNQRDHRDRLK